MFCCSFNDFSNGFLWNSRMSIIPSHDRFCLLFSQNGPLIEVLIKIKCHLCILVFDSNFLQLGSTLCRNAQKKEKKANWEKRKCILPNKDFYIFHLPLFITASSLPFLINHILNSSIRVQISSQTKPVKHLSWSFLEKTLTAYSRKQFRQIIPPQTFERVLDNTDSYFDESNSLSY